MENLPIQIILYGEANSGKTTSLMKLAAKLGGITTAEIYEELKKRTRNKDARFIVEYEGKLIYIGTCGDTWAACRVNINFFERDYSSKLDVYIISGKTVRKYTKAPDETRKPDVCVCACRPEGDSYGAIKALHSYSETSIQKYKQQIWIRKDKDIDCNVQAKELKDIIDRHL